MEHLYDILRRPIISEKSMANAGEGYYVFEVATTATKPLIKKAVESIFKVKVASLQTVNRKGKEKRFRGRVGHRQDTKRAIVRLADGHKLDILPN